MSIQCIYPFGEVLTLNFFATANHDRGRHWVEVAVFKSTGWPGAFLCSCMFSLCLHGFSLGALAPIVQWHATAHRCECLSVSICQPCDRLTTSPTRMYPVSCPLTAAIMSMTPNGKEVRMPESWMDRRNYVKTVITVLSLCNRSQSV